MELANQDQVEGLDPTFGAMAAEMGNRAWGLPGLSAGPPSGTWHRTSDARRPRSRCSNCGTTRQSQPPGTGIRSRSRRARGPAALR